MNKFNKVLSFIFGMSVLVSNNFISAMMEDYNNDTRYFKRFLEKECKYLLEEDNFSDENTKRYIYEFNKLADSVFRDLINNCQVRQSEFYLRFDEDKCCYILCNKTKNEIESDFTKYQYEKELLETVSKFEKELLFIYIATNVLANRGGNGKFNFVFNGESVRIIECDDDSSAKSQLSIEYDFSEHDVRKYEIHVFNYTINVEASKIDVSSAQSKEFYFEYMVRRYPYIKDENEKAKNFTELFNLCLDVDKSYRREKVFSIFAEDPQNYIVERDRFRVTIENNNKDIKNKESEKMLEFYFCL